MGPPISDLERLLQHEAGFGDLISEYHPGFRDALRNTCHSLNGRSQNGSKYKLSHLMYEFYHSLFADLWELALPCIVAEASTTRTTIKLPLSLMKCSQEESVKLFDASYQDINNWTFDGVQMNYRGASEHELHLQQLEDMKHITRDHFCGDFDYSSENFSDHSIEYVKRNVFFIPFVILALHITYLIGRYLVNQQIPNWNEIFYIIKEACISMFGAIHPFCYLALRVVFRLFTCQPLLPRSMQAWNIFNREQELNPVAWTWDVRFEVFVTEPLRIAMVSELGGEIEREKKKTKAKVSAIELNYRIY